MGQHKPEAIAFVQEWLKTMLGIDCSAEEVERSLDEMYAKVDERIETAKRLWPDGRITCARCDVNCQSFYVSEDGKKCGLWGLPFLHAQPPRELVDEEDAHDER